MQKLLLDACVIFPTVMREMLIGAAHQGLYYPLWSARILEEWRRAAMRLGPEAEAVATGDIAMLRAHFPVAEIGGYDGIAQRLWLPDSNDIHVLAAAVHGSADGIVTVNRKDFPKNILAEDGLTRLEPDGLLYGFWLNHPDAMETVGTRVLNHARDLSGEPWEMRALLKKARLPRLAKALGA